MNATNPPGPGEVIGTMGGDPIYSGNLYPDALRRYETQPALLAMLEQILEHPDASIPCQTEAEARDLLRLARGS